MKKYIFLVVVTFGMLSQAQTTMTNIEIGSVFKIGKPTKTGYAHLQLPRANMIIKGGGIVDYKSLVGNVVVVAAMDKEENGDTTVKLKLKNGKRFFGSHTIVSANATKAIETGELRLITE